MGSDCTAVARHSYPSERWQIMYLRPRDADRDPVCTGDKHHLGDSAVREGLRFGRHLLASATRLACGRRLGWPASSAADPSRSGWPHCSGEQPRALSNPYGMQYAPPSMTSAQGRPAPALPPQDRSQTDRTML